MNIFALKLEGMGIELGIFPVIGNALYRYLPTKNAFVRFRDFPKRNYNYKDKKQVYLYSTLKTFKFIYKFLVKGTGTRDLSWLKVVSLERS